MPVRTDYHVHTNHSLDCKFSMQAMCQAAISRGITEVAFTDHLNSHLLDIDLGYYNADRYFADIEACRRRFSRLTIRASVEVGELHRWSRKVMPLLERYPYDVVLGSVHWVGNDNMFNLAYFRARSPQKAFDDYYAEVMSMLRHGGFDILAHVDLPKRVSFDVYNDYDVCAHENALRAIWQLCIDNHITPEINTKGLRCAVKQAHPAREALRWYVEMGGKALTVGSDAHRPDSIGDGFEKARQDGLGAGLTRLVQYEHRKIVGQFDL